MLKKHCSFISLAASDNDAAAQQKSNRLLPSRLAVLGKGMIKNNALLSAVLDAEIQRWYPWSRFCQLPASPQAFIGWGKKKSFRRAQRMAKRQQLPVWSIEDGFIRSLDTGISSQYGMSVVADEIGVYFDLHCSSRLEQLIIKNVQSWSDVQMQSARALMTKLSELELSKYNINLFCPNLTELASDRCSDAAQVSVTPRSSKPWLWTTKTVAGANNIANFANNTRQTHVLLIDQLQGDASIAGAGANRKQFKKMLKVACNKHPQSTIWIKVHPAGKAGYLTGLNLPPQVRIISEAVNPIALLKQVEHVYTVSSHMGFEALILGKTVHCFGVSWYSGWGLTNDKHAPQRLLKKVVKRRIKVFQNRCAARASKSRFTKDVAAKLAVQQLQHVSIEQLFYAAYVDYSHYVDPASGKATDLNSVMTWLYTNRHWQQQLSGPLTIYEFSRWKLPFVTAFVDFPKTQLFIKPKRRFRNWLHPNHLLMRQDNPVLVWGLAKRLEIENKRLTSSSQLPPIYCMEDGFIRSNGLGATLLAPLSVVIDKQGIYYDATRPSDLEQLLLQCSPLTVEQNQRVTALWQRLLTQRVSKYNVGQECGTELFDSLKQAAEEGTSKRCLLIVGQVEDDLSVKYCGSLIKHNAALIQRVRQDNPDAYLIYKPHPDVEAGLRKGKVDTETLALVNHVAHQVAMPDCLDHVDEVHTISSLTGFEALLRGLPVVCYGLPFYAGWGLTKDIESNDERIANYLTRRQRPNELGALTMAQLIYCTLIAYPLYRLPDGYGLAQVEQVIDYLYPTNSVRTKDMPMQTANAGSAAGFQSTASTRCIDQVKKRRPRRLILPSLKKKGVLGFMRIRHYWLNRFH